MARVIPNQYQTTGSNLATSFSETFEKGLYTGEAEDIFVTYDVQNSQFISTGALYLTNELEGRP